MLHGAENCPIHIRPLVPAGTASLVLASDGCSVLTHPWSALRCRLNATSVFFWSLLTSISDFDLLAKTISLHYGIELGQASEALNDFVVRMGSLGFVEIDDGSQASQLRKRYLDLLKSALVNTLYAEHELRIEWLELHGPGTDIASARKLRDIRYANGKEFAELLACKTDGRNWKSRVTRFSHTMVGMRRLQNLEWCADRVFSEGVPGDFMEAGVCQGGLRSSCAPSRSRTAKIIVGCGLPTRFKDCQSRAQSSTRGTTFKKLVNRGSRRHWRLCGTISPLTAFSRKR